MKSIIAFVVLAQASLTASAANARYFCPVRLQASIADYGSTRPVWQAERRNAYIETVIPLMRAKPSRYRSLPKGIASEFSGPMQTLFEATRNETELFDLLQEFEAEVVHYQQAHGVSLVSAFKSRLAFWERYYDFAEPVVVTDYLDQTAFLKLIAAGHPISDTYYKRWKPHTMYGHRIQSILEARLIERKYGDRSLYIKLYKELGNTQALASYDWSETGLDMRSYDPTSPETIPDPWFVLHDTPAAVFEGYRESPNDFSNQDFFGSLREYLPALKQVWK